MSFHTEILLFNHGGQRKYLNGAERRAFYKACMTLDQERKLFCLLLYYTGARISEIYSLTPRQLDFGDRTVILRTLKRRRDNVYRQIPLPDHLLTQIQAMLEARIGKNTYRLNELWPFSKRTASRVVTATMITAGIEGPQTCALGLRHGFAVHAVTKVPLTQVQKWMGHADIRTTAIYLQVSGIEEREWAWRLWDEDEVPAACYQTSIGTHNEPIGSQQCC